MPDEACEYRQNPSVKAQIKKRAMPREVCVLDNGCDDCHRGRRATEAVNQLELYAMKKVIVHSPPLSTGGGGVHYPVHKHP